MIKKAKLTTKPVTKTIISVKGTPKKIITKAPTKPANKKSYHVLVEKQIKEREAKIHVLKAKAEKLEAELEVKYDIKWKKDSAIKRIKEIKDNVVELVWKKEDMQKRLVQLKKSWTDMREDVKEWIENVAEHLEKTFKAVFKKHD